MQAEPCPELRRQAGAIELARIAGPQQTRSLFRKSASAGLRSELPSSSGLTTVGAPMYIIALCFPVSPVWLRKDLLPARVTENFSEQIHCSNSVLKFWLAGNSCLHIFRCTVRATHGTITKICKIMLRNKQITTFLCRKIPPPEKISFDSQSIMCFPMG